MSLGPGSTIGPFKIQSLIGKGGMGEVFSALDTRLDRKVALKLLPVDFVSDSDRLRRFQSEAKTLASLNHPNILVIHEVGAENGNPYLVSEFLEGETLREKLRNGPIPQRRAIDYALQIANGLAAAHAKGIIHRDLKPENILVTKDGRAKILDFGLAKLSFDPPSETHVPRGSEAPTLLYSTLPGVMLGTIGYMSPEQVRGDSVDHRSDIFAFGCVLYETLVGQRMFKKESAVQTMNAVLTEEPVDLVQLNTSISPALDRIVRRCVEKHPEHRFQTANDLAFALAGLSGSGTLPVSPLHSSGKRGRLPHRAALALCLAATLLAAGYFLGVRRTATSPIDAPAQQWRGDRLGGPATAFSPLVSPDGNEIAFLALVEDLGQPAVMMVKSGVWKILGADRSRGFAGDLCWSPDGTEIYYDRLQGLVQSVFRISKYGGQERLVLEGFGKPRILPDGSLVVQSPPTNGLVRFHHVARSQPPRPLNAFQRPGPANFRASPASKEIVFLGWIGESPNGSEKLWAFNVENGHAECLLSNPPPRYADFLPLGFSRGGNDVLYADRTGDAFRILTADRRNFVPRPLLQLTSPSFVFDVAGDGSLYLDQFDFVCEVFSVLSQGKLDRFALPASYQEGPVLPLPNGSLVLPMRLGGRGELMVLESGQEPRPFLDGREEATGPLSLLGPDKLLCVIGDEANRVVAIASLANGQIIAQHKAIPPDKRLGALAGSPDGNTIYYAVAGEIWSVPANGAEARRITSGDAVAPDPQGAYLIVQNYSPTGSILRRVPTSGGDGEVLPIKRGFPITAETLAPNAVRMDGRIAVTVGLKDSWYYPAAIFDPQTGVMELATETRADMFSPGWDNQGRLVTTARFLRSSLWRFRPQR